MVSRAQQDCSHENAKSLVAYVRSE